MLKNTLNIVYRISETHVQFPTKYHSSKMCHFRQRLKRNNIYFKDLKTVILKKICLLKIIIPFYFLKLIKNNTCCIAE